MRKLTKKSKTIIIIIAVIMGIIISAFAVAATMKAVKKVIAFATTTNTTEIITETTTNNTTSDIGDVPVQTTPPLQQQTEETTSGVTETGTKPKLYAYYKTELGFVEEELTDYIFDSVNAAESFSPSVERMVEGDDRQYIEPEVRLYGVPLDYYVSVTCESMVTKAYNLSIGTNDGAYQYFYWQPRLYSASEQGEYVFKITIKENADSTSEQVLYYKISV